MVGLTGSRPGIGHVHQRARGLGQRLVVDCVGHRGGLLLVGLPKVIVCQQHSGPVICRAEKPQGKGQRQGTGRGTGGNGQLWPTLTDCLHGVPLLDEELGSGNVDVHPQRLLLLVHRVRSPRVLTEEVKQRKFTF